MGRKSTVIPGSRSGAHPRSIIRIALCGFLVACSTDGSPLGRSSSQGVSPISRLTAQAQFAYSIRGPYVTTCGTKHRKVTLASGDVTIHFKEDCGVTGNVRVPGVTNLQSPPQYMILCQGPMESTSQALCNYGSPSYTDCEQANSTFWYDTMKLIGVGGTTRTDFISRIFPLKFSSSTLIVAANLYGLCVIDFDSGSIMQDDFASDHAVAPSGDTVHLKVVLPPSYGSSFQDNDTMLLFFESKPAG